MDKIPDNQTLKPLESNSKRQAVPTLRGYAYQIWQSLYQWLNLKDNEVLYLEGAEDYDLLGPTRTETVQIKDKRASGNITLNSDDVIEAISNYWQHQEQNKDRLIYFRFLTTAERGNEKNPSFNTGHGLDYWDSCRNDKMDIQPLRAFLSNHPKLPKQLKEFIKNAEEVELRNRLVKRIIWDTGKESKEFFEELVSEKVYYYGQKFGLHPSESQRVIPHLLKRIWDVICKNTDRCLRLVDFMILFEEITTERINRGELKFLREVNQLSTLFGGLSGYGAFDQSSVVIKTIEQFQMSPPLPNRISDRNDLILHYRSIVNNHGILIVQGSTGMGKSTLAKLLADEKSTRWNWLQLRGLDDRTVKSLLFLFINKMSDSVNLIIEDINFDVPGVDAAFAGMMYAATYTDIKIIATTQTEIPFKARSMLKNDYSFVVVPSLSMPEIEEMLVKHNCPEDLAKGWATIVMAKTTGHPQLVHAETRRLEVTGWAPLTTNQIIQSSEDIEQIRHTARKRLVAELPSDVRTLAYRLSILTHPFRREHAIKMAEMVPALDKPGELFDFLVGPWIERLNNEYYRLSPLLYGSAANIWSNQEVEKLHQAAAQTLLAPKSITPVEASNGLLHGIIGKAEPELFRLVLFLVTRQRDTFQSMANDFFWITFWATKQGQSIFPNNDILNQLLRTFQFHVAAETDPQSVAVGIMDIWEYEIEKLTDNELKSHNRLIFLMKTIIEYRVPIAAKTVISRIVEIARLVGADDKIKMELKDDFGATSIGSQLLWFAIIRCNNIDFLDELLSALDETPASIRDELVKLFNQEELMASFLVNRTWLKEADSDKPRWKRCQETYDRTIILANSWGLTTLVAAAFHAMAVIEDEYKNNPEGALSILQKAETIVGKQNQVIDNERAIILYRRSMYPEALEIWGTILPIWKGKDAPIFSYTHAEICAAQIGNWDKAATLASSGQQAAESAQLRTIATGFKADFGFALWKSGHHAQAVKAFFSVLASFDQLPNPDGDLQSYFLQKRVGHAITWFMYDWEQDHRENHAEPPVGCFSNLHMKEELYEKGLKEFPIQPNIFLWYLLADLEFSVGQYKDCYKAFIEKSKDTHLPYIRFEADFLCLLYNLREARVNSLLADFEPFLQSYVPVKQTFREKKNPLQEITTQIATDRQEILAESASALTTLLLSAIIILTSRGKDILNPMHFLKEDVRKHSGFNNYVNDIICFFEENIEKSQNELLVIMKNRDVSYEQRILAAILVSVAESINPVDRFYADYLLFDYASSSLWLKAIEGDLSDVISKGWLWVSNNQSFSLISPSINVPVIFHACEGLGRNIKKVARILLVAKDSVRISLPNESIEKLLILSKSSAQIMGASLRK